MSIEYEGRRPFERPRKLTEDGVIDNAPVVETIDPEKEAIDKLFSRLTKSYLKGNSLKKALGRMNPAQFIFIDDDAQEAYASARRLSDEESKKGTIITYSLFQQSVDKILEVNRKLKGTIINGSIPATQRGAERKTRQEIVDSGIGDLLAQFLAENGIAGTIIGILTMSPFQAPIFQALGLENGAKGVQAAQWLPGIVLLLELGFKAAAIIDALEAAKIDVQPVKDAINRVENDPEARREALDAVGIDPDSLKKSQEYQDSQNIVNYTVAYYKRYGGLDRPNGYLTIDHWIAYLAVAQNQQELKSAINTAPTFSPKFRKIEVGLRGRTSGQQSDIFSPAPEELDLGIDTVPMLAQFGSSAKLLQETSDTMFDDIINAFTYKLTDKDLCCLVQIFGKIVEPQLLLNIAVVIRILAMKLGEFIARIANVMAAFLAAIAQSILFELVATINKFYSKIVRKILDIFTVDLKYLTACKGMFTLGYAIIESVNAIFDTVMSLIKELNRKITEFGSQGVDISASIGGGSSWVGAAERRFLLGVARLLEVIAQRFALANSCELKLPNVVSEEIVDNSGPEPTVDAALINIIEELPPVLSIPEEEFSKYFDDIQPRNSTRLNFAYGIGSVQNNETEGLEDGPCVEEQTQEKLDELLKSLQNAINTTFNG